MIRLRRAALVAVAVATRLATATPVRAGFSQPTTYVPAGTTVEIVAPDPGPYLVWNGGHHSTCGHGCVWEIVALPDCPAGTVRSVAVTNVSTVDVLVKSYFFDASRAGRAQERNTALSRLTYEAGCTPT